MASSKEIDLIKMTRGFKPDVKYFIRDSFGCEEFVQQVTYPINKSIIEHKRRLIEYGKSPKNHFVELHQIEPPLVISKFYEDYDPLVIIYESDFYLKPTFQRIKENYSKLFSNNHKVHDFFERIKDAYRDLKDQTGFASDDYSANNILVKPDLSDFKIIDVLSFHHNSFASLDPVRFFLTNKYPQHEKDSVLMEFLGGYEGIGRILEAIKGLEGEIL